MVETHTVGSFGSVPLVNEPTKQCHVETIGRIAGGIYDSVIVMLLAAIAQQLGAGTWGCLLLIVVGTIAASAARQLR